MLLARFSISEPFKLVIITLVGYSWAAEMQHNHREVQWSRRTRQGKPWLSRGNSNLTSIIIFLLLSRALSLVLVLSAVIAPSLSVFHPFSRQSDRVCPTGQPFSTHHAHHFLSSFPLVCFFHLLWPVHSPSTTPHKPFYLCVCVCASVCSVHRYAYYYM